MGEEIADSTFGADDFAEFRHRLYRETRLLQQWIEDGLLHCGPPTAGLELEAWLVDREGRPAPVNQWFLDSLNHPLVVPELAAFNVELNAEPRPLGPGLFDAMHEALHSLWNLCNDTAATRGLRIAAVGILPTVSQADLCLANMSRLNRYQALNDQVFRLRGGEPIIIDISGRDHLMLQHSDVMLEAAATSLQIHLKIDIDLAVHVFNVSKALSAPMVALAANSPLLFGLELWEETRIPLFEQAVAVGGSDYARRVTFGIDYAEQSILECFTANRDRYPILLPELMDESEERLPHLRLHNGTIWRWNRPLIGFSADGSPHVRIEHRVCAAGPSLVDILANTAFYFGCVWHYAHDDAFVSRQAFTDVKQNFYAAARDGLTADVRWFGRRVRLQQLILAELIPAAESGLERLGFERVERDRWLGVIRERVAACATGAVWQRRFLRHYPDDLSGLANAYLDQQASERPVHEWAQP